MENIKTEEAFLINQSGCKCKIDYGKVIQELCDIHANYLNQKITEYEMRERRREMTEPRQVEITDGKLTHYFPDTLIAKIELDDNDLERILTAIVSAAEILAEAITDLGKELGG